MELFVYSVISYIKESITLLSLLLMKYSEKKLSINRNNLVVKKRSIDIGKDLQ